MAEQILSPHFDGDFVDESTTWASDDKSPPLGSKRPRASSSTESEVRTTTTLSQPSVGSSNLIAEMVSACIREVLFYAKKQMRTLFKLRRKQAALAKCDPADRVPRQLQVNEYALQIPGAPENLAPSARVVESERQTERIRFEDLVERVEHMLAETTESLSKGSIRMHLKERVDEQMDAIIFINPLNDTDRTRARARAAMEEQLPRLTEEIFDFSVSMSAKEVERHRKQTEREQQRMEVEIEEKVIPTEEVLEHVVESKVGGMIHRISQLEKQLRDVTKQLQATASAPKNGGGSSSPHSQSKTTKTAKANVAKGARKHRPRRASDDDDDDDTADVRSSPSSERRTSKRGEREGSSSSAERAERESRR